MIGAILGASAIAAGGAIAGGAMGGQKKQKDKQNPQAVQLFNTIMAEYAATKKQFRDIITSKPWQVDMEEVQRAQKLMPEIDAAIKNGDVAGAASMIGELPYFETLYKDRILFKMPHISKTLQDMGMTWAKGLRTPAQERLWEDLTGSSRRMLGKERDSSMRQAERLGALAGRPGVAPGEAQEITDSYLRAYGENEKNIRTQNTQDLLTQMVTGAGMLEGERAYGAGQVQQGTQNKMNVQQLINQILSAAGSSAAASRPTGGSPSTKGAALGQGISDASQFIAGGVESGAGISLMQDLLNRKSTDKNVAASFDSGSFQDFYDQEFLTSPTERSRAVTSSAFSRKKPENDLLAQFLNSIGK